MTYLMLATALTLSAVAAYYSIFGLTAIFAAAVIPIVIMGSVLEVAKLVVASWLYRNWKEVNLLMKTYFVTALIVLMFLTSMGIFGFLSKAHLDQALPSGEIAAQIESIDQKINVQKEILTSQRTVLRQLDDAVNQTMGRSTTERGAEQAINIRRSQAKERSIANKAIDVAQAEVNKLLEQRAPIASQMRQIEAEVGPVKYIAALIYGETTDQSLLESAVRIVILLIVFVFDPLAVLMLIAVNSDFKRKRNGRHQEETNKEGIWNKFFQGNKAEDFPEKTKSETSSKDSTTGKAKRVWQSSRDRHAKRGEKRRLEAVVVAENQESIPVTDWEKNRKLEPVKDKKQ